MISQYRSLNHLETELIFGKKSKKANLLVENDLKHEYITVTIKVSQIELAYTTSAISGF